MAQYGKLPGSWNWLTIKVEGSLYYYSPNKVVPIVFAVIYAVSGLVHFLPNC